MTIATISGGVTTPQGFRAAGISAGIKRSAPGLDAQTQAAGPLDLALLVSDVPATAAAVFTTNLALAAPVLVSREHLTRSHGVARAIVVNSGCANACTGDEGMQAAREMAGETARLVGCPVDQVLVASTGVIGVSLPIAKIKAGLPAAAAALSVEHGSAAALAIMTTDPFPKEAAVQIAIGGRTIDIGGMAKGSGMIEPMMATMLAFVTTDAYFVNGLRTVCRELALGIVRGGEGATKLITVRVTGAASANEARRAAKAIANSPLVKTAIHGGDPNWGRLIAAAGRAGVAFDLSRATVTIGPTVLFEDGRPYDEAAPRAAEYLRRTEVDVSVGLGAGNATSTVWTCDLSAEYVRINADYRT
jgi:glutamate N-acetyltransferase/amino-acid N-acetyltransferase